MAGACDVRRLHKLLRYAPHPPPWEPPYGTPPYGTPLPNTAGFRRELGFIRTKQLTDIGEAGALIEAIIPPGLGN